MTRRHQARALSPVVCLTSSSHVSKPSWSVRQEGSRHAPDCCAHDLVGARDDRTGLRLAESATYNIREAFDAVVEGKRAGEGGFQAVQAAWLRYQLALVSPEADEAVETRAFHAIVERLCADDERQAFMTRKLIGYLVDQTGVAPLPGVNDPTRQYTRLRERAATTLHADEVVAVVAALFKRRDRLVCPALHASRRSGDEDRCARCGALPGHFAGRGACRVGIQRAPHRSLPQRDHRPAMA